MDKKDKPKNLSKEQLERIKKERENKLTKIVKK